MQSLNILQNRIQILDSKIHHCHFVIIDLSNINNTEFMIAKHFLNDKEKHRCEKFVNFTLSSKFAICRVLAKYIIGEFL
ncbi:hypothetical protein [Candidatus Tisiphia endosymbiont of Nemotelus uliginosus]|uniref:hypothetical protein n=1 Tax=Candidatus Tisiphia endosymbiont of Nemotelus uliginosus TaxID=3077926 RepID=UPI0035C90498